MPFIGNTPDVNFTSFAKQTITGNGGTSYTLSHAVANENEVEIFVNNVRQEGGSGKAYTVSGTALTMTGNVADTDSFYVIFLGKAIQTTVPPDGSVSTAKLADSAVTTAKLADNSVTSAKITGVSFGKVLQVVNATSTSQLILTNTSFVAFNLNASITPSSTSSKILVSFSVPVYIFNSGTHGVATIFRESGTANQDAVISGVNLGHSDWGFGMAHNTTGNTAIVTNGAGVLDSPNSTSAVRYTIAGRRHNSAGNNHIYLSLNGAMASITLMEIGA